MDKLIAVVVSLIVITIGVLAVFRSSELQQWHIRQFFGQDKPVNNWFYRQMTSPSTVSTNKFSGWMFILAGALLLVLTIMR